MRKPSIVHKGGKDKMVIDLIEGDSDFPTPRPIVAEAINALTQGKTHYIEPAGLLKLRQTIVQEIDWIRNSRFNSPENIVVTPGGKYAIYAALACLLKPGDSVLIIDPSWPSFDTMVNFLGGIPIHLPTLAKDQFSPQVEKLRNIITTTSNTRVLIINSPNNPTGRVYSPEEIRGLIELANEHDLYVLCDEVYRDLVYDVPYTSAIEYPEFGSRIIVTSSFSKGYAMTGWRLGYLVSDSSLTTKIAQFQLHTVTCANSVAQHTAWAALLSGDLQRAAISIRQEYGNRRELVKSIISKISKIDLANMEGTPFAWMYIGRLTSNSKEFCERLIEEYEVAVMPGCAYPGGEGFIRLCYAKAPYKLLEQALFRLNACIENW